MPSEVVLPFAFPSVFPIEFCKQDVMIERTSSVRDGTFCDVMPSVLIHGKTVTVIVPVKQNFFLKKRKIVNDATKDPSII